MTHRPRPRSVVATGEYIAYPQGIYRLPSLDFTKEIFQISNCQERASSKRILNFKSGPLSVHPGNPAP
ncbi:MAG: hypothetical protein K2H86_04405 [Muribaculaceae bacterium]|nr:hypothetical protein [Muribaculaceae bacterium]